MEEQLRRLRLQAAFDVLATAEPTLNELDRKQVVCRLLARKFGLSGELKNGQRFGEFDIGPELARLVPLQHVGVPGRLYPRDFDWRLSRPIHSWNVDGRRQRITLIEVSEPQLRRTINEAKSRFDRPDWQIRELLALLIDTVRACFGLIDDDDLQADDWCKDGNSVVLAVLRALKEGRLVANDDHERPQTDPNFWVGKTKSDLLRRIHFWVRCEEALMVFSVLRSRNLVSPGDPAADEEKRWRVPNGTVASDGRRRPGPKPGTVRRYDEADRALFPEIDRIMKEDRLTAHAAALKLAHNGQVAGQGSTPESRAKRLATEYLRERETH